MPKKTNTLVNEILGTLCDMSGELLKALPRPFETPYEHVRRMRSVDAKIYRDTIYNLQKRGIVAIARKNNKRFIKLTRKGQLEILFAKAKFKSAAGWDGKWRLIVFDIPEGSHEKRDSLRYLLKKQGFLKLQASVFINPYPLNREAVRYLKETKLDEFIRMMRVDEIDNDKDLKKKFKL